MSHFVLTFHKVNHDGTTGRMIGKPMVFDSWASAHEYGRHNVEYGKSDFQIHETVLFSQPVENNG
jgi:hypothetical protein